MVKYALKRLLWLVPTLLGVLFFLFSMTYMLPGDPADIILGPRATPEMVAQMNQRLGLDQPWPISLVRYLGNILQGDLGTSIFRDVPVEHLIMRVLPYTIMLTLSAMFLAIILGIGLGIVSSAYENTWLDKIITFMVLIWASVPNFIWAVLFILIFSLRLGWLPVTGGGEPGNLLDQIYHLIGPAIALSLTWAGYIARIVRSSMLETLQEDFITTEKSFGLPMSLIFYKYALKRAIKPAIAVIALGLGRLLGGAVFIEVIFSRPGLGQLLVDAIEMRNLPVIRGGVMVAALLFVLANMLADISYAYFDPRIRYE